MPTLAVLMTVHNRKEKTIECLRYLYAQNNSDYEIEVFLTDDGSTDGTQQAVLQRFPDVEIIIGKGDLYWNRGMYSAWKTASLKKDYDFYLWLNDDTLLSSTALDVLLKCSLQYLDESIVVGTTSAMDDSSVITYGGRKKKTGLIAPQDSSCECELFNGNIVLIPRYVYKTVGMNDPRFRHALGDFDYGLRARKKGIKLIVAPGILGMCDLHDSLPNWCNPEKSFKVRWKAFRTPLGHNPEEFFIYEYRHHGFIVACFHYFTNHLRVVYPKLWKKRI